MLRARVQQQWLGLPILLSLLYCGLLAVATSSEELGRRLPSHERPSVTASDLQRSTADTDDLPLPVLEGIAGDPNAIADLFAFDAQDASDSVSSAPPDDTNEIVSHHNDSGSYYILQLPEVFLRCHSAKSHFTFVPAPAVASKLHELGSQANYAAWQELTIRALNTHAIHLRQLLPIKQTSWYWDPVDLGVGTRFAISLTAFLNSTVGPVGHTGGTDANATDDTTLSTPTPRAKAKVKEKEEKPTILAHAVVKSNIVVSDGMPNACDPSGPTDLAASPATPPADGSVGPDGTTTLAPTTTGATHHHEPAFVIIVALLCAFVGLFGIVILALMIYKHRHGRLHKGGRLCSNGGSAIALTPVSSGEQARYLGDSTWPARDGSQSPGRSAGWAYMTRLVPGLSPLPEQSEDSTIRIVDVPGSGRARLIPIYHVRRARGGVVRRREAGDEDLPSYGKSEEDKKALPKYEVGWRAASLASTASQGEASSARDRLSAIDELGEPNERGSGAEEALPQTDPVAPAMTTVLHYLPSSPDRPLSAFETSQIPADATPLSDAEASAAVPQMFEVHPARDGNGVIAFSVTPAQNQPRRDGLGRTQEEARAAAPGHGASDSLASLNSRWSQWSA